METKCSVEKLWIWWVYWKEASRHLTKTWQFFCQFTYLSFPSQAIPASTASHGSAEGLRQSREFWTSGESKIFFYCSRNSHWWYLTVPQVKNCRSLARVFNKKHEILLSKYSLFSHEEIFICNRYLCFAKALRQRSLSDAKSAVWRSPRSVSVLPGSDPLEKVSSVSTPASHYMWGWGRQVLGLGPVPVLPKRLWGQSHGVYLCTRENCSAEATNCFTGLPEISGSIYWAMLGMTSWPSSGRLSI